MSASVIVERLREVSGFRAAILMQVGELPKWLCIKEEAANEIDRLRTLHKAAIAFMQGVHPDLPAKFDDAFQAWALQINEAVK